MLHNVFSLPDLFSKKDVQKPDYPDHVYDAQPLPDASSIGEINALLTQYRSPIVTTDLGDVTEAA